MAEKCYRTYRREKCVARIRSCLRQDSHAQPGDCVGVAQTCLYEEEEEDEKIHPECVQQIPLCLPHNTQVVNFVLLTTDTITVINQDYSLLSPASCFQYIDECNEKKNYQAECLLESKQCFTNNYYGFDHCFKMLTDCVRDTEEHEHEEEEYCGCSCEMEKCFGLKDGVACSAMFDLCFAGKEGGEDGYETEGEEEERGEECLERVRDCLYQSDHHQDLCVQLMTSCLAGEEEEESDPYQDCSQAVIACVATNKFNIAACSDLFVACTASSEEATSTRDCYSHIELCYRTTPSYNHQVCSGLAPACYQHGEISSTSSSCHSTARSCLLNNFIKNSDCQRHLGTCLAQQYQGNVCKENIKLCLASSQYSASSCYDDLQLFLTDRECSATNQDHSYHSHQYQ